MRAGQKVGLVLPVHAHQSFVAPHAGRKPPRQHNASHAALQMTLQMALRIIHAAPATHAPIILRMPFACDMILE